MTRSESDCAYKRRECVTHHACDCSLTMIEALRRIADMPIQPRSDGTYNYSREALIRMAQEAVNA